MSLRKILNRLLAPSGYELSRKSRRKSDIIKQALAYREALAFGLAEKLNFTVASGPFSGLRLTDASSWSLGDLPSKLVGLYEQELHPFILECAETRPDCIVNVGCADGYYAAGFGRLISEASIFGMDIDPKFEAEFYKLLKTNELVGHFRLHFKFSDTKDFESFERILWIVDCEGYEQHIVELDEQILLKSNFLIECHDCFVPGVTDSLKRKLSLTHDVSVARFSGRNPNDIEIFSQLDSFEKFLVVCEFRSEVTQWIYARARGLG